MRRNPNFEIFKEPRGFIKIVEIGIAIFAFSTTAGYYSEFKIDSSIANVAKCNGTMPKGAVYNILTKFEYPFDDKTYYINPIFKDSDGKRCKLDANHTIHHEPLKSRYKSESQFFVVTGVATFIYCLIASAYYALFEDQEQSMYSTDVGRFSFVVIDFIISVILVIFWFTGSVAWASGLPGFKDDTDPFQYRIGPCSPQNFHCEIKKDPIYATLEVSIILGFLNLFVWLGNLWFLFKETPWHNPRQGILHDNSTQ